MRRRAQPWMGTLVDITIADPVSETDANAAFTAAFSAIASVHALMSFHAASSDVSRINRAAVGQAITVSPHTYTVLQTAFSIGQASGGIFNIFCAPTLVCWDYLPAPDHGLPACVAGGDALALDAGRVMKTRDAWLDLGGIAKGYAVDQAIAALQNCGIASACVNAGGDLRVLGQLAYPVSVRHPADPTRIGRRLEVRGHALATSATYFSKKLIGDKDFSAIVDGVSGLPVVDEISVSVCAPACMIADALTKLVIAGRNPNHPVLERFSATAFII